MYSRSTLSHSDAVSAVELFEQGFTAKSVTVALGLAVAPVQMVFERWQLRGKGALVTRERRQYGFEIKLEIVLRHIKGESGRSLCEEFDLPSPSTVAYFSTAVPGLLFDDRRQRQTASRWRGIDSGK